MANILLVEDEPDLGLYEASLLEAEGHTIIRCGGGPTPFEGCPLLKLGSCPLVDEADLIVFTCQLIGPMRHRTYRGVHLLRAYRSHERYGKLPMLVVAYGAPRDLEGTGPLITLTKFTEPAAIIDAVHKLLHASSASRRRSRTP